MTQSEHSHLLPKYGQLAKLTIEELYKKRIENKDRELEKMRLKKEREEKVQKEKERIEKYLEEEQKKSRAKIIKEREDKIIKEREDKIAQEAKKKLHNKLFESFYGSEDEILKNKKTEQKYLFIYQIEDEGLQTEELTASEIEERLDKFALCRNNYVIVSGGKVVEFPLSNNLKP